jgi:hypothetical protein
MTVSSVLPLNQTFPVPMLCLGHLECHVSYILAVKLRLLTMQLYSVLCLFHLSGFDKLHSTR